MLLSSGDDGRRDRRGQCDADEQALAAASLDERRSELSDLRAQLDAALPGVVDETPEEKK